MKNILINLQFKDFKKVLNHNVGCPYLRGSELYKESSQITRLGKPTLFIIGKLALNSQLEFAATKESLPLAQGTFQYAHYLSKTPLGLSTLFLSPIIILLKFIKLSFTIFYLYSEEPSTTTDITFILRVNYYKLWYLSNLFFTVYFLTHPVD